MTRVIVVALLSAFVVASNARAQSSRKATTLELPMLPRFCWAQFSDTARGPEFSMPPKALCGAGTNHYCIGLVNLLRAKRNTSDPASTRASNIRQAKRRTLYTVKAIERYPNCPIRSHVQSTLMEIEALERVYIKH